MTLHSVDWILVGCYLAFSLGVGFWFSKRASGSVSSYFVSGRKLPWWLLGTSMVATTFAADTPLAVTGWIRTEGIWKNWFWWNYALSHALVIIVFSRLWRRAEVVTDNELIELRYSGRPAAFLRGFKAFYFSTVFNFIVMGWVITAMTKVFSVFFGVGQIYAVCLCVGVVLVYTVFSGLWGVVVTDFVQYAVALFATVALAVIVINSDAVGGYSGFLAKIGELDPEKTSMFISPPAGGGEFFSSDFFTFAVFMTVVWWSSHNADGGGYFIQRLCSARDERHALWGTAWFALNHYVLRFWPWVLVALASAAVFPDASPAGGDDEAMYLVMINEFLSPGLRGLLLVSFLAAFMSTVSTHLNWGASYLVNDVYGRFVRKNASQGHYVRVSRIATVVLAVCAGAVALRIKNIGDAWIFLWAMSSGIGLVLILRWFWWRINAWSEIAALGSSLLTMTVLVLYTGAAGTPLELRHQILVVPVSIACWVAATFLTAPEPAEKLRGFCERVRPPGFWSPVRPPASAAKEGRGFGNLVANWLLAASFLLCLMLGTGKLLLGETASALGLLAAAALGLVAIVVRRRGFFL